MQDVVAENEYYVYKHLDPNTKEIFYIGKGVGTRIFMRGQSTRFPKLSNWDKRVLAQKGFLFDIIMGGLSEDDAYELEEFIIAEYHDYKPGMLINEVKKGETARAGWCNIPVDYIGLWRNREYMNSLTDEEYKKFNKKLKKHLDDRSNSS